LTKALTLVLFKLLKRSLNLLDQCLTFILGHQAPSEFFKSTKILITLTNK
jgi:hypothetical protein